jgi:hypothetical protein
VEVASSILADQTTGETRVLACSHRTVNAVHHRRWWFDSTLTHSPTLSAKLKGKTPRSYRDSCGFDSRRRHHRAMAQPGSARGRAFESLLPDQLISHCRGPLTGSRRRRLHRRQCAFDSRPRHLARVAKFGRRSRPRPCGIASHPEVRVLPRAPRRRSSVLVEHLPGTKEVPGSNPGGGSICSRCIARAWRNTGRRGTINPNGVQLRVRVSPPGPSCSPAW